MCEESFLLAANGRFLEVAAHAEHTLSCGEQSLSIGGVRIVAIHTGFFLHKMPMEFPFEFLTQVFMTGQAKCDRVHADLECVSIRPSSMTSGAIAFRKGIMLIRSK
jgi:hypothetical protein